MQLIMRRDVKDDRIEEFVEWVTTNRAAFDEHAPDGWSYAGTYVTVYGFGTHEVEVRWDVADYADLGPGRGGDEWRRMIIESQDFFSDAGQTSLVKTVDDVEIIT